MQKPIEMLQSKIVALTQIMESELSDLKSGRVITSEVLEEKIRLTSEIENAKYIFDEEMPEEEKEKFKESLKSFLDIAAILKFEIEKNIFWTNNIISEINNFIEIKLKGVNLYSSDGNSKRDLSNVSPITLFERI